MENTKAEIAAIAARLVVEDGLDYGAAKRRACKQLGLSASAPLPDNAQLELAVQDHIAVFCADTQATELQALRRLGLAWMLRLERFRPHISGAVWHGTATRHSDIHLDLFCDDPKSAEIGLIDQGVRFTPRSVTGFQGQPVDALSLEVWCPELDGHVGLHLLVHDHDALRGALTSDARGRRPRGNTAALRRLLPPAAA